MEPTRIFILLHLVGLVAFLGAAFAQTQFMRMSAKTGAPSQLRDEYERLAASIITKIELPGLFAQVVTGAALVAIQPDYLKQHWLHGKLTAVFALLILAHIQMFNARKIAKARAARGDAANDEIAAMKKKHAVMGGIGTLLVVAVLLLATVLRTVIP